MLKSVNENNNSNIVSTEDEVGWTASPERSPPESSESEETEESEEEDEDEEVLIGKGGFGYVYQYRDKETGQSRARKEIEFKEEEEKAKWEEVEILRKLQPHNNIVTFYSAEIKFTGPRKTLCIRMEFCNGGTVYDYIRKSPLDFEDCSQLIYQIIQGLDHMHKNGFAHGDLRSKNICLDSNGNVKIIDFGQSERLTICDAQAFDKVRYQGGDAKRVLEDIQSYAELIFELLFGPFRSETEMLTAAGQFKKNIVLPFEFSKHYAPPLRHLLPTLLNGKVKELPEPPTEMLDDVEVDVSPDCQRDDHAVSEEYEAFSWDVVVDGLTILSDPELCLSRTKREAAIFVLRDRLEDIVTNDWIMSSQTLRIGVLRLAALVPNYNTFIKVAMVEKTFTYKKVYNKILELASRVSK